MWPSRKRLPQRPRSFANPQLENPMMYGKTMMAKAPAKAAGKKAAFKPCAGCPNPAKCKAVGKCLAKKKN